MLLCGGNIWVWKCLHPAQGMNSYLTSLLILSCPQMVFTIDHKMQLPRWHDLISVFENIKELAHIREFSENQFG
jgi:hypothetical protein